MKQHVSATLLFIGLATGCSASDGGATPVGKGKASFTTWGEAYIETGIPKTAFADGWSVKYSKFLLTLREVTVARADGTVVGKMAKPKIFDHVKPGVKAVASFADLDALAYPKVSYQIGPVDGAADLADGVTAADRDDLVKNGASLHVVGEATNGAVTKTFDWYFPVATLYQECKAERDGKETDGVVVTNGGDDVNQLTVHGDHLFYDDLASKDAKLRFQNIADADKDGDGKVTLAELGAVKLASIPKEKGTYGTGASSIDDLGAFVAALSRTVGHYRGEGECFSKPLK